MSAVRLEIQLSSHSEWIKIFDPRDWTVFVAASQPIEYGASVRIDLDVGGWLVTLRGTVEGHRDDPAGVIVALGGAERDKINYLNGFVRGGVLNLRGKRRLPVKLEVTYGAVEGPTTTFTKDINEEGVFLFTDRPLPEASQVHMLVTLPGRPRPLSLVGKVSHTIIAEDDHDDGDDHDDHDNHDSHDNEPPGMGIVFDLDDAGRAQLIEIIGELEAQLHAGKLPTSTVE